MTSSAPAAHHVGEPAADERPHRAILDSVCQPPPTRRGRHYRDDVENAAADGAPLALSRIAFRNRPDRRCSPSDAANRILDAPAMVAFGQGDVCVSAADGGVERAGPTWFCEPPATTGKLCAAVIVFPTRRRWPPRFRRSRCCRRRPAAIVIGPARRWTRRGARHVLGPPRSRRRRIGLHTVAMPPLWRSACHSSRLMFCEPPAILPAVSCPTAAVRVDVGILSTTCGAAATARRGADDRGGRLGGPRRPQRVVFKNEDLRDGRLEERRFVDRGRPPARIYFQRRVKSRDGRTWERLTANAPWAPRAGAVVVDKGGWMGTCSAARKDSPATIRASPVRPTSTTCGAPWTAPAGSW